MTPPVIRPANLDPDRFCVTHGLELRYDAEYGRSICDTCEARARFLAKAHAYGPPREEEIEVWKLKGMWR